MGSDQQQSNKPAAAKPAAAVAPRAATPGRNPQANAQKSAGAPLGAGLRGKLEQSLGGEDLADVRVHTDSHAAEAAQGLGAKAFTVGQSIFFNEGQFNPESGAGQELIGHEVAHTVQQRGAGGDTAQLASMDVSSPGDAHEQQAESFGSSFASGGGGKVSPVSKGVISRAVIQRDLLDGKPPGELATPPAPINANQPSTSELAQHAAEAIRNARSGGGTSAVVAMVHQLRGGANGATAGAVESAVGSELTQAEHDALDGKTQAPTNAAAADNKQGAGDKPQADGAKTGAAKPEGGGAQAKGGAADAKGGGEGGDAKGGEAKPGAAGAKGGDDKGAAAKGAAEKGGAHAKGGAPAEGGAHAGGAEGAAAEGGAHAEHPPHVSAAGGRELIEQELSFHEKWEAYSKDSAGSRAMALLSGVPGDIGQGLAGGSKQFLIGQGMKLMTTQTALGRIPGVGNIIGGALSAYSLFSHGGAGIKDKGHEIAEGFSGLVAKDAWSGDNVFLTLANLVGGIKATLELIGNVCQILSGLAYAFAAIAALGGLLSIFFPPLAILLPYIPMAINFGRACGGIATACLGIASLISPIPPLLRAVHLIVSNNDPITLVQQDAKFHSEAQGAIANYTSAAMNGAVAKDGPKGPVASLKGEVKEGIGAGKQAMQPGAVDNIREGLGMSDARLRVAQTEAVVGGDTKGARQIGSEYFNPDARAGANQANLDGAEAQKKTAEDRLEHRQERLQEARDSGGKPTKVAKAVAIQEGKLAGAERNMETAESGVAAAETRSDAGGRNASFDNMGDAGPGALERNKKNGEEDKAETATEAFKELREGKGEVETTKDAKGHVVLPPPPGKLADIEAMDHQIEAMREEEKGLSENAAQAKKTQQESTTIASGLTQSAAGVQQKVTTEQGRSQQEQQRINAQTADVKGKTTQATGTAQSGTSQGAASLQPVASAARSVDGIVQRVPSNKFFNVDGTKRNIHQFVVGMDQITGSGPQTQQQGQAAAAATEKRTAQVQQAEQANHAGAAAGQQLTQKMTQDAGTAKSSASQAAEVAAASTQAAAQATSKSQQLQAQRDAKWNALLSWASEHRAMRATLNEKH